MADAETARPSSMDSGPLAAAPCADAGAEAARPNASAETAGPSSMAEGPLATPCADAGAEVTALDAAGGWLLVGAATGRLQLYSSPSWRAPARLVADADLAEGAAAGPVEQVSVQPASGIALALRAGVVTIHLLDFGLSRLAALGGGGGGGGGATAFALNADEPVLRLAVAMPTYLALFRLGSPIEQLRSLPLVHGCPKGLLWQGSSLACGFRRELLLLCDESGRLKHSHAFEPDGGEAVAWEHERWIPGQGWGKKYLPTDAPAHGRFGAA
ncbi:hypothetical protein T492DRAFT_1143581, partial [Pavlovales sp. CCMP2436]